MTLYVKLSIASNIISVILAANRIRPANALKEVKRLCKYFGFTGSVVKDFLSKDCGENEISQHSRGKSNLSNVYMSTHSHLLRGNKDKINKGLKNSIVSILNFYNYLENLA